MTPQIIFYIIIGIILFNYSFQLLTVILESSKMTPVIPEEVKDFYDEEKYRRQQSYKKENMRFGYVTSTLSLVLILGMLFLDGFGWLDSKLRSYTEHPILLAILFFAILGIASDLLSLPFSIYNIFVIEEKFGFNKTTVKTFILDKIKSYLIGGIVGGGMLALIILIWTETGDYFWLIAWGVVSGFSIFMSMFYTSIILPLFNKLEPIKNEGLRNSIRNYADKVNFKIRDIFQMDSSKRSTKANAFFSGLGPRKKIVLFDTLVDEYSTEEITAVLAHEIGHYKKKHTMTSMLFGVIQIGFTLFLLSLALRQPVFSEALGAQHSFHIGVLVFALQFSPISMITGIIMNTWSRKNEYEADAYATKTYDGEALISALKKLSVDSLSNLRPHPLNVFVNYSHPPVLKRIAAIRKVRISDSNT